MFVKSIDLENITIWEKNKDFVKSSVSIKNIDSEFEKKNDKLNTTKFEKSFIKVVWFRERMRIKEFLLFFYFVFLKIFKKQPNNFSIF